MHGTVQESSAECRGWGRQGDVCFSPPPTHPQLLRSMCASHYIYSVTRCSRWWLVRLSKKSLKPEGCETQLVLLLQLVLKSVISFLHHSFWISHSLHSPCRQLCLSYWSSGNKEGKSGEEKKHYLMGHGNMKPHLFIVTNLEQVSLL